MPAISLMTIGNYYTLLQFCLENKLIVKSLLCYDPRYYDPRILPAEVKSLYLSRYQDFLIKNDLTDVDYTVDYNESDVNQLHRIIKNQIVQCIEILKTPQPPDAEQQLQQMVYWFRRWDDVNGYDARLLYPELCEVFDRYGY